MSNAVKTWRHVLHGVSPLRWWAIVFLDANGTFSAVSDFGSYGYYWPAHGCADFREFLIEIADPKDDYALRKLSHGKEYDGEKTCRAVKQRICEKRRCDEFARDEARAEWDLLEEHDDLDTVVSFSNWSLETKLVDGWDLAHRSHSGDAIAFCREVLPKLADVLRAELAAEHASASDPPRRVVTPTAWLLGSDTGLSSMTICAVLAGEQDARRYDPCVPADAGDFGRCHRMLALFPGWRERLGEVAVAFPFWAPFVEAWDELATLYEEEGEYLRGKPGSRFSTRIRQASDAIVRRLKDERATATSTARGGAR